MRVSAKPCRSVSAVRSAPKSTQSRASNKIATQAKLSFSKQSLFSKPSNTRSSSLFAPKRTFFTRTAVARGGGGGDHGHHHEVAPPSPVVIPADWMPSAFPENAWDLPHLRDYKASIDRINRLLDSYNPFKEVEDRLGITLPAKNFDADYYHSQTIAAARESGSKAKLATAIQDYLEYKKISPFLDALEAEIATDKKEIPKEFAAMPAIFDILQEAKNLQEWFKLEEDRTQEQLDRMQKNLKNIEDEFNDFINRTSEEEATLHPEWANEIEESQRKEIWIQNFQWKPSINPVLPPVYAAGGAH